MGWRAIVFTHEQVSELEHVKVEDEFDLIFSAAGCPAGMTLYELKSFPIHPIYYITPESEPFVAKLLERCEVVACRQPPPEEIQAIAGDMYRSNAVPPAKLPEQQFTHRHFPTGRRLDPH